MPWRTAEAPPHNDVIQRDVDIFTTTGWRFSASSRSSLVWRVHPPDRR